MSYPSMTNEEFRDRIKAIVGPLPRETKPTVRTPSDRGYYPPPRLYIDGSAEAEARRERIDNARLVGWSLAPDEFHNDERASESQGEVRP